MESDGSRISYARFETAEAPARDRFTERETAFIAARDSFYMATVAENGWPYVQHRGGPAGFLKVLDDRTLGFADYRGNRQFVSVGNLAGDGRVSLFLMDYPNRRRLKMLGRARLVDPAVEPEMMRQLRGDDEAGIERGILISLEGFDWNCPQHITRRFSEAEISDATAPLRDRLSALEAENASLRSELAKLGAAR
jgi:uncharacterized protein